MDAGAWCLSWVQGDPLASPDPDASCGQQDKHKAPAHPHVRPLSLQQERWGLDCRMWLLKFIIVGDSLCVISTLDALYKPLEKSCCIFSSAKH